MCGFSPFVLQGAFQLNLLLSKMSMGDSFWILIMHLFGEELIVSPPHTGVLFQEGAARSIHQPQASDIRGMIIFYQHIQ